MCKRPSSIDVITKYDTNRNAEATKKWPPGPHRNHAGVFGLVNKTMSHTLSQIHAHAHARGERGAEGGAGKGPMSQP